ncbi:hypothetical protein MN032_01350 [Agromyces atrinae]|uniref:hypothetical protein n=1 Tax=Agromyces atrinae TaxID=592376 RepID=UPI001F58CDFA|nr:hypothetical protein [Agromyces atrinae]MCI2956322.1 hypothetical protein [Agromyces atrinae]
MQSPLDLVAIIAESLSWLGLGTGLVCLVIWASMRTVDGRWLPTQAVVVDGVARWFVGGDFHERTLSHHERAEVTDPDDQRVYYSDRDASRMILEPGRPSTRVLKLLTVILLSVGAVSLVVSIAAPLAAG